MNTNILPTKTHPAASITREAAGALIDAARGAAARLGFEAAIAVTDASGHLKGFERTDGARYLTVELAINKAWTVTSFGLPTHTWNSLLNSRPEIAQLAHTPRLMPVGGGCPIVAEGQLVGAIGMSGGNEAQDREAAEIALRALGFEVAG